MVQNFEVKLCFVLCQLLAHLAPTLFARPSMFKVPITFVLMVCKENRGLHQLRNISGVDLT